MIGMVMPGTRLKPGSLRANAVEEKNHHQHAVFHPVSLCIFPLSVSTHTQHTVEIQIRVEEIPRIRPALFKLKVLQMLLREEMLLPRRRLGRQFRLCPDLHTIAVRTLGNDDRLALVPALILRLSTIFASDAKRVDGAEKRPVQVRLIRIRISIKPGVDEPLHNLHGLAEARRQLIADRVVKVVAKHQVIAVDVLFEPEIKGQAVEVRLVRVRGEVGRRRGRVLGQAVVFLHADAERGVDFGGADVEGFFGVDGDELLRRFRVVWTGRHLEYVFVRHFSFLFSFAVGFGGRVIVLG